MAVLTAGDHASDHHRTGRHEEEAEQRGQQHAEAQALGIRAEFCPAPVPLGDDLVANLVQQEGRTDRDKHHRHRQQQRQQPHYGRGGGKQTANAAHPHEAQREGEGPRGEEQVTLLFLAEVPEVALVVTHGLLGRDAPQLGHDGGQFGVRHRAAATHLDAHAAVLAAAGAHVLDADHAGLTAGHARSAA